MTAKATHDTDRNWRKMLDAINRAHAAFIANESVGTACEQLLTDMLDLTQSEYGFIGEVLHTVEGAPYLRTHAITNIAWDEATLKLYEENASRGMEFYNLKSLFGAALTSGKPVISNDPGHDPRRGGLPAGHPPLNAFLGIPIMLGEKLVAMAGIANRAGGYDEELVSFLQPLLASIGHLVEARRNQVAGREADKALAQTNSLLSNMLDAASEISVIATDPAGLITVFNRGAERLLGYEAKELVGKETPAIFHLPAEVEARGAELAAASGHPVAGFRVFVEMPEKQGAEQRDWTYIHKSGKHIPVSLAVTPIRAASGEITGYLGIAQSIAERKQAERKLCESEQRLRDMLEDCPTAARIARSGGREIDALARQSGIARRLATIPGIGSITATALIASIGDPKQFHNGRQLAAWLGLVPRQYSTGGKTRLGRITKQGDKYLRTLLIHGTRAVLAVLGDKRDRIISWLRELIARRGYKRAAVEFAAKNARIVWAVLTRGEDYRPQAAIA